MRKAIARTEKHEVRVTAVRVAAVADEAERQSEVHRQRTWRNNQQNKEVNNLRGRQIQRRNAAMRKLLARGVELAEVTKGLAELRPDITPAEFSYHIVTYSRSGKLTAIDVMYKAVAHAKANLPMPWEICR